MGLKSDSRRLALENYPLRLTIPTRYGDMDTNAHLNNVAIARLMEEAAQSKSRYVRIADRADGGHFRPGDTVTLVVSKGPEPIEVPDVTGDTVAVAMQTLRDAGFEPGTALPEIVWGIFTVSSTSPAAGTMQLPGTKITVLKEKKDEMSLRIQSGK